MVKEPRDWYKDEAAEVRTKARIIGRTFEELVLPSQSSLVLSGKMLPDQSVCHLFFFLLSV